MTKEEEKLYLREAMYDYMEASRIEMEALTSKCLVSNPRSIEFVDLSARFGGYFSTKTWLYNNASCESIDDLQKRIQTFQEILVHPKNVLIENYMESACFAELSPFDSEKCLLSFEKNGVYLQDSSPIHIRQMGESLFQQGLKMIKELLDDEHIKELEKKCNFMLYNGGLQEHWTGVGFYQVIQSNHECLRQLQGFYQSVSKDGSEPKTKK